MDLAEIKGGLAMDHSPERLVKEVTQITKKRVII